MLGCRLSALPHDVNVAAPTLADDPADALERQRRELAADLHDGVAPGLTYARMSLPLLREAIERGSHEQALRCCDDLQDAIGQAQGALRVLIGQWRAAAPLASAAEGAVQALRRHSGLAVSFDCRVDESALAPDHARQLLLVLREALNNAARHAAARRVDVRLLVGADCGAELVVEDDGRGPEEGAGGPGHHGLEIMRERAAALGGSVEFGARDGGGSRLRLRVAHLSSPWGEVLQRQGSA